MKKNVASQVIGAEMITASDGTAFTGSVTVYVTGDGGTQALGSVSSGACTHEGNGFHTYAPAQAETNYDHVAFTFIGTGAIPATVQVFTTFPQTGDSYARLGAPAGASVSADIATIDTVVDAVKVVTDALPDSGALTSIATASALTTVDTVVDAIKAVTDLIPDSGAMTSIATAASISALNDPTAAAIADAVWDESTTSHTTAGTFGEQCKTDIDAILADTNELQGDWVNGGRLDLLVDGIKAVTDVIPDSGAMTSIATATALATVDTVVDAIKTKTDSLTFTDSGKVDATLQAAADLKAAVANRVADHTLRRSISTALSSSDGDTKTFRSLAGATSKLVNKVAISGSTLTIYEADDSTSLGTQALTTSSSADPVTAVDTA